MTKPPKDFDGRPMRHVSTLESGAKLFVGRPHDGEGNALAPADDLGSLQTPWRWKAFWNGLTFVAAALLIVLIIAAGLAWGVNEWAKEVSATT